MQYPYVRIYGKMDASHLKVKKEGELKAINEFFPSNANYIYIKILAPELFFKFSTPVYKMWIKQEPNTLDLWNKLHFEEGKNGEYTPCLKYSVLIFVE